MGMNGETIKLAELCVKAENLLWSLGYKKSTIIHCKTAWREFLEYSLQRGQEYYDDELATSYLKEKYNYPDLTQAAHSPRVNGRASSIRKLSDLYHFGYFLGKPQKDLVYITPAFTPGVLAYMDYCRKRNLVEDTLFRRKKKLNSYFEYLHSVGITRPEDITIESIHNYLITLTGLSQKTGAGIVLLLRQFFDAIYFAGIINVKLSEHVPTMKLIRQDKIPEIWTDDAIERLLAVVDRGNPLGKRDYAILLIVIRLGLRDSDVRNLRFENIIWSKNRIEFVQSKTTEFISLPLSRDIGEAIIDYLKNGRPCSESPFIFIKHTAPYSGIQKVGNIVTKYRRLAGIPSEEGIPHGIHSLRHSLANRLLAQNVPLAIISGILGHTTVNASKEYLHLDIDHLRQCALEVGDINE